ncbi:NAD-dependent epimerase [Streptomyces antimycoticus]|uniref:NAD-dependent epimerase n=1 Tax=Streptomyces antimycoticus TaxID=68175 RepID=A0A499V7Z9_9ACTN|nr:NAD(P)-dependent oxidoreductase [Streptomyces antimycoticus]BBJ45651.1 NAD-dependent epimerase [Streptomyces antimycoticus]
MTHVLVTGAAGHIGRHVVEDLLQHGYRVTATDRKPVHDRRLERSLTGDLRDRELVREALRGVAALVHLAAIPHPDTRDPAGQFTANCHTAYLALDEAGRAGVRRVVAASSIGALGLAWSTHPRSPGYVPVDESHATLAEDPYGLSKLVLEQVAEGTHRRWGTDTVCLRFPFTGTGPRLTRQLAAVRADPGHHASDLWGWLDTRDAAAAVRAALGAETHGSHVLYVAAPDTSSDIPTAELLARYHPTARIVAPLSRFAGLYDTSRCTRLLGFAPAHDRRTADAVAEGPHRSSPTEGT